MNPSRKEKRQRDIDARMLACSQPLSREVVADTKLLPDRIALLDALPKNGVVAEVGVAMGAYSSEILSHNSPRKLYLIDAWHMAQDIYGQPAFDQVQQRFNEQLENGQVEILRGWSWEMLETLEDESLDWIYIDAGHEYESVQRDLAASAKKVKPDGFICGHDYTRWGRHGARFGVLEAVNRFVTDQDYQFKYLTLENNYNWSYCIQKAS